MKDRRDVLSERVEGFPWVWSDNVLPFMMEYLVGKPSLYTAHNANNSTLTSLCGI